MEASAGLVAGSQNRNELVVIRLEGESAVSFPSRLLSKPLQELCGQICQICGDDVGRTAEGELFVACNECAFPICKICYDYERREGSQGVLECKAMKKRMTSTMWRTSSAFKGRGGGGGRASHDSQHHDLAYGGRSSSSGSNGPSYNFPSTATPALLLTYGRMLLFVRIMVDDIPPGHVMDTSSSLGGGGEKIHPIPSSDHSPPVQLRAMDPSKDLSAYGYGSVAWKERMKSWKYKQDKMNTTKNGGGEEAENDGDGLHLPQMDEARQPLSRKKPIKSSQINPYRIIIIIRLIVLGFFFHYRVMHPVHDAYALWLISVVCEIWFALSWILDQFPKWLPIERETYLDRLSLRFVISRLCMLKQLHFTSWINILASLFTFLVRKTATHPSQLCPVDIYVSTVDPLKEPPLVTVNTVLSILAADYPTDKVSCYVSDDGAAMLTFEALSETSDFAKRWVPFCKKFNIEPRAPEWYFAQKIDYLKDKVLPSFIKERREVKREYEEFKVRINALVAKAQKVPEEGWTMQDGTPWPGNNVRDHPGMIQVFLDQSGGLDTDGKKLPRLLPQFPCAIVRLEGLDDLDSKHDREEYRTR
ncbi:LOW QUALITY PROTEIN: hypothetical protein RJ639_038187 [Escallonia herrerae]|uniref:Cellulose synthase n=1 Tax=Escallonia herrerae TaxID=1293975 RepID=A0AA88WMF2_9ASTE|nr:LOW QUALITY PROTEIN: hypothetical protein RJ639_038187 [Escallonia herrerae]